jgi:hypothetical protein
MLLRLTLSFTCTLSLLAAGCGDDHTGDDTSTHASHSGGDTSGGGETDDPTTGGAADSTGTTAAVTPPAAPTDLMLSILEGGVHATWKDASDNEDNFVLEKKAAGDADYAVIIELPFDSVTYHDIDVMAGMMYTYRVKATNAGGESMSGEVPIQVP